MDDIEAEVLTETALTEKVQKRRVKKGDKVNDDSRPFNSRQISAKTPVIIIFSA